MGILLPRVPQLDCVVLPRHCRDISKGIARKHRRTGEMLSVELRWGVYWR